MPDSTSAVVMDADRISRTLTRIAHEIVELQRIEFVAAALGLHRVVGKAEELRVGGLVLRQGLEDLERRGGIRRFGCFSFLVGHNRSVRLRV